MNIAIFRTDRLGDMILTLPMCNVLKHEYPHAHITIIARKENSALLSRCSYAFDTIIYEEEYEQWDVWTIARILRNNAIEMVYFPRPRFEEICAAWVARVSIRVGSAYRWYSLFLNYKVHDHRREATFHELEYNIRLIEYFTKKKYPKQSLLQPTIDEQERINIRSKLSSIAQKQLQNIIIIHPGSRGSSVDWSVENFGQLAQQLASFDTYTLVITGTKPEYEKCALVSKHSPQALNLCGLLSLHEVMALLCESSLLIANSTGILHLATALHTPVIGLYPNDPSLCSRRWGPYSAHAAVLTPLPEKVNGGWNNDMSLISVETVEKTARSMIE